MDRRTFIVLAIGLVLIAAAAVVFVIARGGTNVDALIKSYRAGPTQAKADRLAAMIETCSVSPDEGTRILEALLKPEVQTRDAYPTGKTMGVNLVIPCAVTMSDMSLHLDETLRMDGRVGWVKRLGTSGVSFEKSMCLEFGPASGPGMHSMSIERTVKLKPSGMRTVRKLIWPSKRRFPLNLLPGRSTVFVANTGKAEYEYRLELRFNLKVVAPEDAVPIAVRRNEELDRKMMESFSAEEPPDSNLTCNGLKYRGGLTIRYTSLPESVSFRMIFRDADGQEHPSNVGLAVPAEKTGSMGYSPSLFGIKEPGRHKGTLILRPDPDRAYCDPSINAIWGGELEFPMEIEVEAPETEVK
ncbi:MAG TPA: hypothetical protein VM186_13955 [Planctomycetota bacterium]|nr:hypothetical protein [Planctomycetota bacterium]